MGGPFDKQIMGACDDQYNTRLHGRELAKKEKQTLAQMNS